jgi:hypothetical protein
LTAVVPKGRHVLEIGLGMTNVQLAATLASLVSLAGFLVVMSKHKNTEPARTEGKPSAPLWLAGLCAVLFIAKVAWIDNTQTPLKRERFASGIESGVQTAVRANFDNKIDLLGYDLDSPVPADQSAQLNLYWRLHDTPIKQTFSLIRLQDSSGNTIWETGSFYPGGLATELAAGDYVQGALDAQMPPALPRRVCACRSSPAESQQSECH